ncbi:hypothetical protein [Bradyrhizobium algeriense]|uniref:hypothetical protein n=1 Tax=Bradyrhizobium algeriense TaxID=634784 RepID=UPI0011AE3014|nr:hypothetical protein [Bradyrhizobium algeriense]
MTQDDRFSLRDLKMIFGGSAPRIIQINYMFAASNADRVESVNAAIDWIVLEHTKTAHHRIDRDEDSLTTDIIVELNALGFDASHDTDVGGHRDIVIKGVDGFLWLAEAKIHSSYKWLFKGLQQLCRRYSTGMLGQNDGSLIIYCKGPRVDNVMAKWFAHLAKADAKATITVCDKNPLVLNSRHTHERTGLEFRVRHVPVSLYHNPQD